MEQEGWQTPDKEKLGESFCICKLLFHKTGPTLLQSDFRIAGNAEKHAFRDACEAQGLLMKNFDSSDGNASDSDSMTGNTHGASIDNDSD